MQRRLFSSLVAVFAFSSVSACTSVDYSQMPFYDDLFREDPPKIQGPRRIPSHQPQPSFKGLTPPPAFNNSLYKKGGIPMRENGIPSIATAQPVAKTKLAAHSVKTDMFDVGYAKDPDLFSDPPLALKPFSYNQSPTINKPPAQAASDNGSFREYAATRSNFTPEKSMEIPGVENGYQNKNYSGHAYFPNKH